MCLLYQVLVGEIKFLKNPAGFVTELTAALSVCADPRVLVKNKTKCDNNNKSIADHLHTLSENVWFHERVRVSASAFVKECVFVLQLCVCVFV